MSNGIQRMADVGRTDVATSEDRFHVLERMAEQVAKSGLFKMTPPQVLTLMLLAESEGIHPIKAMMRYHIIEGRPSMRADTMQAEFQAAGGRVEWITTTGDECEAHFYHPVYRGGKEPFVIKNTLKEYMESGVAMCWKDNKQQLSANWKRFSPAMLRARAITAGVRAVLPSVIMGMYADEDEGVIDVTPTEQTAHAGLQAKLKARLKPSEHPPVAETVAELKAAQEPASDDPKSEFRAWVDEQLVGVNAELHAIAEASPDNVGARVRITPYQVANHLINEGVEASLINEKVIIGANGKRDKQACSSVVIGLWEDDSGWCMDVVGKYLAGKVVEAQKTPEPAVQQALIA